MSKAKHTKGPWRVEPMPRSSDSIIETHYALVTRRQDQSFEQMAANARLMAAAPEMLEALKRLADWIDRERVPYLIDSDDNPGEAARAAIAKAEGRS